MKKTYIKPTTEVVKIQTQQMLAVSAPLGGSQANEDALAPEFDFYE